MEKGTFTETEFTEFQEENTGNVYKYISPREVNEQIHNNSIKEKMNHGVLTMDDWCKKSNHFISCHIYDRAKGDFITLGNLEIEMNNIE